MVKLIIGKKGSGKTKKLIDLANEAVNASKGNVVVIEKGSKLTYDLTHKARLVDAESYNIVGYDALFGFVSGICAGNYDVTDILIDSTFKLCGNDMNELEKFVSRLNALEAHSEASITVLLSADKSELPEHLEAEYIHI